MKKKVFKNFVRVISLIGGLGMIYARWNGSSSMVIDFWITLFIFGECVTYGDENKDRNILNRIWVVSIVVLLIIYILITILNIT